jgi:hypothetical protein
MLLQASDIVAIHLQNPRCPYQCHPAETNNPPTQMATDAARTDVAAI